MIAVLLSALLIAPVNATQPSPKLCFLSGDVKKAESAGFNALGNHIRLRFEADTDEECKVQFEIYCRREIVGKRYVVGTLKGYFEEPQGGKVRRVDFVVRPGCEIQRSSDKRS